MAGVEPSDGTRDCLRCPRKGKVEKGKRSVRCKKCREDHAKAKAADAQWDRRQRKRDEANDRRTRLGYRAARDPLVRPRKRTEDWDQYGRPVLDTPRLTPAQMRAVHAAADDVQTALNALRRALRPGR